VSKDTSRGVQQQDSSRYKSQVRKDRNLGGEVIRPKHLFMSAVVLRGFNIPNCAQSKAIPKFLGVVTKT